MVHAASPANPASFPFSSPVVLPDPAWNNQMQEQQLALFFLDIRDFTPLIAARPLSQVMHLLQQLFAIFQQAITSNQGRIIETTGDGLYAVFGLDDSFERATPSAVQAGFAILQAVAQANQTYFMPGFNHQFQVGIGLHVGNVGVGQSGLGISHHTAVMGYAVNVAARLQTATKRLNNNFIISGEAYNRLTHPPMAVSEQITLKGIPEKMNVHLAGRPYTLVASDAAILPVAC